MHAECTAQSVHKLHTKSWRRSLRNAPLKGPCCRTARKRAEEIKGVSMALASAGTPKMLNAGPTIASFSPEVQKWK